MIKYLNEISKNKRQLIFLVSIFTFSLSIISIVFGVNSNVLDEYMRVEESYRFQTIKDIISFPIQQHQLFNQSPREIKIESGKGKEISHTIIIDATVERDVFQQFQFQQFMSLLEQENGIIQNKLTKDDLPIVINFALRRARRELGTKPEFTEQFYFMKGCGENDNQALYKPTGEDFLGTDITEPIFDKFKDKLCELIPEPTDQSKFDLLFKELKDQKEGSVITIISDFNEERDRVSDDVKNALGSLKKEKPNLKFNLIEVDPNPKVGKDNSSSLIQTINSHFRTNHIDLSQRSNQIDELKLRSLLAYNQDASSTLVLVPVPKEERTNGYKEYLSQSEVRLNIETGEYMIHFESKETTRGLELLVNNEIIQITPGIDYRLKIDTDIVLRYQDKDYGKFIGLLRLFSVKKMSNSEYLLVQKRVLNLPTIGFSMLCYSCAFVVLGCLLYIVIRPLINSKVLAIITSVIIILSLVTYSYTPRGLLHYLSELVLPFWQFYLGILVVVIIFWLIRIYEKNTSSTDKTIHNQLLLEQKKNDNH